LKGKKNLPQEASEEKSRVQSLNEVNFIYWLTQGGHSAFNLPLV
jgi:hypothetical protein